MSVQGSAVTILDEIFYLQEYKRTLVESYSVGALGLVDPEVAREIIAIDQTITRLRTIRTLGKKSGFPDIWRGR